MSNVPEPGGSSSDAIIFPTDQLREVAAKILVQADTALQQHNKLWAQVQTFLHENDDHGNMAAVLNPHDKRMRASYDWQMQLASTLFQVVDLVEGADDSAAQGFTPRHHGNMRIE